MTALSPGQIEIASIVETDFSPGTLTPSHSTRRVGGVVVWLKKFWKIKDSAREDKFEVRRGLKGPGRQPPHPREAFLLVISPGKVKPRKNSSNDRPLAAVSLLSTKIASVSHAAT
jgi:hypothetical protein